PLPENLAFNLLRERSEPVPARLAGIPIFLVFEVVALGFFLVAAMIFQEKQEGVIRALRVSPTGTLGYVLSKTAVFLILSLAYALLLLLLSMGLDVDYPRLLLLVALSSTMMTMAGIAVAVFFNNISEWFFAGTFVLLIFILPSVSYAIPSFAPAVLSWIPSYPVVFGIRELLFPTGKAGFLLNTTGLLVVYNLAALALAYWAVQKKLMQA
ncbi:MAG: ABC transporter permease, partial [Anaerolineales bacterium]|nr:ABC transporter permease [Anaerolineales bacterium]